MQTSLGPLRLPVSLGGLATLRAGAGVLFRLFAVAYILGVL